MTGSNLTAWLLILLILPIGIVGGPTTLLCIGGDGHVAIESGSNGSCKGESDTDHKERGDCDHDCDHTTPDCGDCVDFTLELVEGCPRQIAEKAPFSVQFIPCPLFELTILPGYEAPLLRPDQPHPPILSLSLESYRTVRLLI